MRGILLAALAAAAAAAAIDRDSFLVLRLGTAAQPFTLTNAATTLVSPLFLDELNVDDPANPVLLQVSAGLAPGAGGGVAL